MADKPKLEVVPALPADALDLSDLWLDPGLGDGLVDTVWNNVPFSKPKDFFRVHPSPDYRRRAEVYVRKPEGLIDEQPFVVAPSMRGMIEEARPCLIVTCIYRDVSPRLWLLKSPRLDEKENNAWSSARAAARTAMTQWVRLTWVRQSYQTRIADDGYAPDPDWTKLPSFDQLVTLALGVNGIIRDTDHPVYRDLIGAAPRRADDNDDL